jgi:hypothetical protein
MLSIALEMTEQQKLSIANPEATPKNRLWWLLIPMSFGAFIALFSALREGWTVGDTIGACAFFAVSALIGYEVFRRRRKTNSGP